jgi:hypothetical protein
MLGAITSLANLAGKYGVSANKPARFMNIDNSMQPMGMQPMGMQNINMSTSDMITFLIVFMLALFITILLGMYIFNMTIPKIFPAVRKVSMMEFFGLYIITHMLFC